MARPDFIREAIPLAPLTTLQLGGPARYFAECASVAQIRAALGWAQSETLPVQVLGGGSNAIVPDQGYDGLVLKVGLRGVDFDGATTTVAAGEDWDPFVRQCVERGLAGIECLSGIPGLVGATPIQNVGAYGQEVKETIVEVRAIDRATLGEVAFDNADCAFAYRQSRFKGADRNRYIVTSVIYRLDPDGQAQIRYPEVRRQLDEGNADLQSVRDTVLRLRRGKSMVIDPQDPNTRSAGSFFLNPVVSEAVCAAIEDRHPGLPRFPAPDGVKIPAAWLVEHAGFRKGQQKNGAAISDHHALALVNRGGTTRDLLALADEIRAAVEKTFAIRLEREPILVGEN